MDEVSFRRDVGTKVRAILGRRLTFALVFVALAAAIPMAVMAEELSRWDSTGPQPDLSLKASPGETVGGWAAISVTWQARTPDESASRGTLVVDEEGTTLPTPHVVSAMTLRMPSPWDEGEYVWDAYGISLEAPVEPGEYQYVVKRAAGGAESGKMLDITIVVKVG